MFKRSIVMVVLSCLIVVGMGGCNLGGSPSGSSGTPIATDTTLGTGTVAPITSPTSSVTLTPLHIAGISMSISPSSIATISCGSANNFTYTASVAVADGGAGGPISYTWKIGGATVPGMVTFAPNETSKNVTYTLNNAVIQFNGSSAVTGTLTANYHGTTVTSAPITPGGNCTLPGPFRVVGITISVSPAVMSSITCNSLITVTWTATITIGSDSNGGTVSLIWNNLRLAHSASITFGASLGSQAQSVTISETGRVEPKYHNGFPPAVSISATSPNAVTSVAVTSVGFCA